MIPIAVTLSILAVLVAIATLLGHRAASEEILLQTKPSDQWAYFQAKNIRLHEMETVADMFATLAPADKEKAEALREKYVQEAERKGNGPDQRTGQRTRKGASGGGPVSRPLRCRRGHPRNRSDNLLPHAPDQKVGLLDGRYRARSGWPVRDRLWFSSALKLMYRRVTCPHGQVML